MKAERKAGNKAAADCRKDAVKALAAGQPAESFRDQFHAECTFNKWKNSPPAQVRGVQPGPRARDSSGRFADQPQKFAVDVQQGE